jgi:hypothetical protein
MKIAILVEGATEMAFRKKLHEFLQSRLEQKMPRLDFKPQHGGIPKEGNSSVLLKISSIMMAMML